jgi:predicted amidophosphoribosyltransferase
MVGGMIGGQVVGPILDLLLPCVCPACRAQPGPDFCADCHGLLPRLPACCPRCCAPGSEIPCPGCRGSGLAHIASARAGFAYTGTMKRLIGDAKAGARAATVQALAGLLPLPEDVVDAVVAVPPSPGRRPGPHLATACARHAAHRLGVPLIAPLRCVRHASEQHRLSRAERARNVVGLFRCQPGVPPRLLLVDDILTSGATASAAAAELHRAGARCVHASFLCRTPQPGDRPN